MRVYVSVILNYSRLSSKRSWSFTNATINLSVHWCVWRNTRVKVYKVFNVFDVLVIDLNCRWNICSLAWDFSYLRLMVSPKSEYAEENLFNSVISKEQISYVTWSFLPLILLHTCRVEYASIRSCMQLTPTVDKQKARFNMIEKKCF